MRDATKRTLVDIATCQRRERLPPLTTPASIAGSIKLAAGFLSPAEHHAAFISRNATLLRLFQHELDFSGSYDRSRPFFLYRSQSDPTGMKLLSQSLSRSPRLDTRNPEPLMSALGHKRTSRRFHPMSVLPPKADMARLGRDVRFVPKADILRRSKGIYSHVVGSRQ